jgi:hypothetical protein
MNEFPGIVSDRASLAAAGLLALALSACAGTPPDTSTPLSRSCTPTNCFEERNVRDFQIIDQRTIVVYVGSQRCPFLLELDGMFCDLTFTPTLQFGEAQPLFGERASSRICPFGRTYVSGGPFSRDQERCRILDIVSLTDDELVDVFVNRGVIPPVPPVGYGELEVLPEGPPDAEPNNGTTREEGAGGLEPPAPPETSAPL